MMHRHLSNQNMLLYRLITFAGLGLFFWIFKDASTLIELPPTDFWQISWEFELPFRVIITVFYAFGYYLFLGRFYSISMQEDFLACSQLFRKKRIPYNDLIYVTIGWIPYKLFFKKAYPIIIKYRDQTGKSGRSSVCQKR